MKYQLQCLHSHETKINSCLIISQICEFWESTLCQISHFKNSIQVFTKDVIYFEISKVCKWMYLVVHENILLINVETITSINVILIQAWTIS
jgi:hypothetical protein